MFFLKIGTPDKIDAKSSRLYNLWSQRQISVMAWAIAKDSVGKYKVCLAQHSICSDLVANVYDTTKECVPGRLEFLYAELFLPVQEDHQSHPIRSRAWSSLRLWWFVRHGEE